MDPIQTRVSAQAIASCEWVPASNTSRAQGRAQVLSGPCGGARDHDEAEMPRTERRCSARFVLGPHGLVEVLTGFCVENGKAAAKIGRMGPQEAKSSQVRPRRAPGPAPLLQPRARRGRDRVKKSLSRHALDEAERIGTAYNNCRRIGVTSSAGSHAAPIASASTAEHPPRLTSWRPWQRYPWLEANASSRGSRGRAPEAKPFSSTFPLILPELPELRHWRTASGLSRPARGPLL
jgi:hypothetical protein